MARAQRVDARARRVTLNLDRGKRGVGIPGEQRQPLCEVSRQLRHFLVGQLLAGSAVRLVRTIAIVHH